MSGSRESTAVTVSRVQGFEAITLANRDLALTTIPELGGKISSLIDRRSGREWLWTSEALPYRKLPYGTSYVGEADTGGWDECFPTVAACRYPGPQYDEVLLPDHGELWPRSWETEIDHGAAVVRSRVAGTQLSYEFERSIEVLPGKAVVRLEYNVRNLADHELLFIWCAHPLLAVEPGMQILLPSGTLVRRYSSIPDDLLAADEFLTWPPRVTVPGGETDFATIPEPEAGIAAKLWSEKLSEGWAALRATDGEMRFVFDPELVPQVGLWLNAGGWSATAGDPYFNLGLEPGIGAQDSLNEAVERYGQHGTVAARGERCWWLEVHLSTAGS